MNVEKVYMMKFRSAPDIAIHQSAGMRASVANDPPVRGAGPLPPPRAGSGRESSTGTSSAAGAAATAIATRQPNACATGPLIAKLSMMPAGTPIMKVAMARARRAAGTRSPIQLADVGAHPPRRFPPLAGSPPASRNSPRARPTR